MTRDCTLKLIRVLAEKNNCEYVEPDEDVLRLMIQFAELVEERCADKLKVNDEDLFVIAGTMTSRELWTTKFILACMARRMK